MLTPEETKTVASVIEGIGYLQAAGIEIASHGLTTINSLIAAIEGLPIDADLKTRFGDALRMAGEYRLLGLGNALDHHGFSSLDAMRDALRLKLNTRTR